MALAVKKEMKYLLTSNMTRNSLWKDQLKLEYLSPLAFFLSFFLSFYSFFFFFCRTNDYMKCVYPYRKRTKRPKDEMGTKKNFDQSLVY